MVSRSENMARVRQYLRFSKQEITGLVGAIFITGFIFSFRDAGDTSTFNFILWFTNLVTLFVIAALSFLFRISCQKTYALTQGYNAEFKVWWTGLVIAIVIAFISVGYVPLILIGGVVTSLMVRHRLGEFRYGASHTELGVISLWGVWGNMIAAMIFGIGLQFFPESYFFNKGLLFNVAMAFFSLLPLAQLDGLKIFYGSRFMYMVGLTAVVIGGILLLTKTTIGLLIPLVIALLVGMIYILKGSEK